MSASYLHARIISRARLTSKRLLDIHHLQRTRLHESSPSRPRPLQPLLRPDLPRLLQIALVSRHNLDRRRASAIYPALLLHADQLVEILERVEGIRIRDVVAQQEGIGLQVGRGPEAAVFFLAGGVGQVELVGLAVDGAGHAVRVFDGWIVLGCPL